MASIQEAMGLLDGIIANKRKFLEKKPNTFLEKEIDQLIVISKTIEGMNKILGLTQSQYKNIMRIYEHEFEGKINPSNYDSHSEWMDAIDAMTKGIKSTAQRFQ